MANDFIDNLFNIAKLKKLDNIKEQNERIIKNQEQLIDLNQPNIIVDHSVSAESEQQLELSNRAFRIYQIVEIIKGSDDKTLKSYLFKKYYEVINNVLDTLIDKIVDLKNKEIANNIKKDLTLTLITTAEKCSNIDENTIASNNKDLIDKIEVALGNKQNEFEKDQLYEEARSCIIKYQIASVSLLQRHLQIGYSRASKLLDSLEENSVIGPFDGSKTRQVLIANDEK